MGFQTGRGAAKLVRVAHGRRYDVIVDIRRGSQTFGEWEGSELTDENIHALCIPSASLTASAREQLSKWVLHLSAGQMRRRPTTDHRGGLRHGRSSGSPSRLAGRTRLSGGGGSKLRRPELGLTTSERYVRGVACSACSSSR